MKDPRVAGRRSYGQKTLFALILLAVLLCCVPAKSVSVARNYFRAGLRNSDNRPIAINQLQNLLENLRQKTGLLDLKFDADGFLELGDRNHIQGGSPTARALILSALESGNCFKLESCNRSSKVAFAQIDPVEIYNDGDGIQHRIFELRLDFQDYADLMGQTEALSSFDPAMGVFHELGHGVLGLHDLISKEDPLGECERHMNQIRRELNLPERQSYKPVFTRSRLPGNTYDSTKAELTFIRIRKEERAKKFLLLYDAEKVSIKSIY